MIRLRYWFYFRGFARKYFVNERSRQVFLRRYPYFDPRKAVTVHNPVIDEIFLEKVNRAPEHPWLVHKECPVVIAVGSYAECKNHLMVMEAIRLVNRTRRVRLVIFGKGPLEETYRQYIEQHHLQDVISIGHFSCSVPAEMRAADVLVSSSLHESFSIVLVEALAAGTPVVSTDAPLGPREVLENGKYGKLVPIGDCPAMAKAILAQIDEKGKPIPEEAWKRFTVEAITARYLAGLGALSS